MNIPTLGPVGEVVIGITDYFEGHVLGLCRTLKSFDCLYLGPKGEKGEARAQLLEDVAA